MGEDKIYECNLSLLLFVWNIILIRTSEGVFINLFYSGFIIFFYKIIFNK